MSAEAEKKDDAPAKVDHQGASSPASRFNAPTPAAAMVASEAREESRTPKPVPEVRPTSTTMLVEEPAIKSTTSCLTQEKTISFSECSPTLQSQDLLSMPATSVVGGGQQHQAKFDFLAERGRKTDLVDSSKHQLLLVDLSGSGDRDQGENAAVVAKVTAPKLMVDAGTEMTPKIATAYVVGGGTAAGQNNGKNVFGGKNYVGNSSGRPVAAIAAPVAQPSATQESPKAEHSTSTADFTSLIRATSTSVSVLDRLMISPYHENFRRNIDHKLGVPGRAAVEDGSSGGDKKHGQVNHGQQRGQKRQNRAVMEAGSIASLPSQVGVFATAESDYTWKAQAQRTFTPMSPQSMSAMPMLMAAAACDTTSAPHSPSNDPPRLARTTSTSTSPKTNSAKKKVQRRPPIMLEHLASRAGEMQGYVLRQSASVRSFSMSSPARPDGLGQGTATRKLDDLDFVDVKAVLTPSTKASKLQLAVSPFSIASTAIASAREAQQESLAAFPSKKAISFSLPEGVQQRSPENQMPFGGLLVWKKDFSGLTSPAFERVRSASLSPKSADAQNAMRLLQQEVDHDGNNDDHFSSIVGRFHSNVSHVGVGSAFTNKQLNLKNGSRPPPQTSVKNAFSPLTRVLNTGAMKQSELFEVAAGNQIQKSNKQIAKHHLQNQISSRVEQATSGVRRSDTKIHQHQEAPQEAEAKHAHSVSKIFSVSSSTTTTSRSSTSTINNKTFDVSFTNKEIFSPQLQKAVSVKSLHEELLSPKNFDASRPSSPAVRDLSRAVEAEMLKTIGRSPMSCTSPKVVSANENVLRLQHQQNSSFSRKNSSSNMRGIGAAEPTSRVKPQSPTEGDVRMEMWHQAMSKVGKEAVAKCAGFATKEADPSTPISPSSPFGFESSKRGEKFLRDVRLEILASEAVVTKNEALVEEWKGSLSPTTSPCGTFPSSAPTPFSSPSKTPGKVLKKNRGDQDHQDRHKALISKACASNGVIASPSRKLVHSAEQQKEEDLIHEKSREVSSPTEVHNPYRTYSPPRSVGAALSYHVGKGNGEPRKYSCLVDERTSLLKGKKTTTCVIDQMREHREEISAGKKAVSSPFSIRPTLLTSSTPTRTSHHPNKGNEQDRKLHAVDVDDESQENKGDKHLYAWQTHAPVSAGQEKRLLAISHVFETPVIRPQACRREFGKLS
ncbi:unnamed protein product [Amoebophrya sp. A25]|nr:unnamed protein product [Amoebophrya sp. A25]|eukprot:GSA25T00002527001.1